MLPFENVREQLLRAGIAPRHANRYVTELREHLNDLESQERASGLDVRQASERAMALLGTDVQLAQVMLDRRVPRSLAARAPWSVFAVLPVVLLLAVILTTGNSMMQLLGPVRDLAPSAMPEAYNSLIAAVSFITNYLVGPLLAAGCIATALRQRVMSRWVWIGLGLIALVSGPFGFHMHFIPSDSGGHGSTLYSAVGFVYRHGRADIAATLGVSVLRAAVLFALSVTIYRTLQLRHMSVRR
jgi:hypothetical protein